MLLTIPMLPVPVGHVEARPHGHDAQTLPEVDLVARPALHQIWPPAVCADDSQHLLVHAILVRGNALLRGYECWHANHDRRLHDERWGGGREGGLSHPRGVYTGYAWGGR